MNSHKHQEIIEHQTENKMLSNIKKFALIDIIGNAIGILLIHFIFLNLMQSEAIQYWTALVSFLLLLRMVYYILLNNYMHILSHKQWENISISLPFMAGIAWGSLIFFSPSDELYTLTTVCLFFAVLGGALGATGHQFSIFAAFGTPLSLLVATHLFLKGGNLFFAVAVANLAFLFISLYMSYKFTKALQKETMLHKENVALIERLKNKTQIAEKANAEKSRFLASASHDLRQPIHALNLFSNALEQRLTNSDQHELLGKMDLSIQAMNSLLTSLLDISRLEAGLIQVQTQSFQLYPLLYHLEEEFIIQANELGLKLSFCDQNKHLSSAKETVRNLDVIIQSDQTLLESILRNLIDNALKYTTQGSITISCNVSEHECIISIKDTGIGIPHDEQQKVYDEFYQIGNPERDRNKGIGLGLSIVNKTCHLLNHELTMTSSEGQGTQFNIHLPIASEVNTSKSKLETITQIQATILVVDDEQLILDGMHAMLESWGCEVLSCQTPDAALELAQSHPNIDMLLVDYRLREHRIGSEVVHEVRELLNKPRLPSVIISGDADATHLLETNQGSLEILYKPIKPAQLRNLIEHLLK